MVWRVASRFASLGGRQPVVSPAALYALFDGLFQRCLLRHLSGDRKAIADLREEVERLLKEGASNGNDNPPASYPPDGDGDGPGGNEAPEAATGDPSAAEGQPSGSDDPVGSDAGRMAAPGAILPLFPHAVIDDKAGRKKFDGGSGGTV